MLEKKSISNSQERFLQKMEKYMYDKDIDILKICMLNGTKFIHNADIMDDILIVDKKYKAYYFELKKK